MVGINSTSPAHTLDVVGDVVITGASTHGGATQLNNTLNVTGVTTVSNNFTVGTSLAVTATSLGVGTTLTVNRTTQMVGINSTSPAHTLDVVGDVVITGTSTIGGATQLNNTLNVTGITTVSNNFTTLGNINATGTIACGTSSVTNGITCAKVGVGTAVNATYELAVQGDVSLTGSLVAQTLTLKSKGPFKIDYGKVSGTVETASVSFTSGLFSSAPVVICTLEKYDTNVTGCVQVSSVTSTSFTYLKRGFQVWTHDGLTLWDWGFHWIAIGN